MGESRLVPPEDLERFTFRVVEAMGAAPGVAGDVARHLVGANLSGHDSHGVLRLPQYVADLDQGGLVPAAATTLTDERLVTALFDAHLGFGQHSTMVATEWAIARAREHGLAGAAVRHSTHIGRLGEYTERMAGEGLVGLLTVGAAGPGMGRVAPFAGAAAFLGTNPWSIGVPAGGRPPFIFDAASSTIAEGKARLALVRGLRVPEGSVLDPAGQPTQDPAQLYAGGTLTVLGGLVAGHKGLGLSLASALVGGLAMISDVNPTSAGVMRGADVRGPRLAGVFLAAIDPGAFGDPAAYQQKVGEVLDALTASPPAPGFERVQVPGDPERVSRERRSRLGIPLPAATWADLAALATRFGVELP